MNQWGRRRCCSNGQTPCRRRVVEMDEAWLEEKSLCSNQEGGIYIPEPVWPVQSQLKLDPGPPPAADWTSYHCCSRAATATGLFHRSWIVNVVLIFGHEKRC